jgi:AcrR family transcriptional regulator
MSGDGENPTAGWAAAEATRPRRADAARNHERILEAAEAVFANQGIAVPIDEVAAKAGVGVGTIYRHFPTKEALFEAIVVSRLARLSATADAMATAEDPGAAFFGFLEELGEQACAKRDLSEALMNAGVDIKVRAGGLAEELQQRVGVLLVRAQEAGAVRTDVDALELLGLVFAACSATDHAAGRDPEVFRRLLHIICDGLRA